MKRSEDTRWWTLWMTEARLRWYGQLLRDEGEPVSDIME